MTIAFMDEPKGNQSKWLKQQEFSKDMRACYVLMVLLIGCISAKQTMNTEIIVTNAADLEKYVGKVITIQGEVPIRKSQPS